MIQASKSRKKKTRSTSRKSASKSGSRSASARSAAVPEMEAGHVDRIRDIIFGPQMRDYERRFQLIEKEIQRTLKGFQERIDRNERGLIDKFDRVAQVAEDSGHSAREVGARLEDVRKAVELDQRRLGNAQEQLKNEVAKHLNRLTDQFAERLEDMREEMRTNFEQMRQDYLQAMEELHQAKASKDEVGDLLIELGLRLKGEEVLTT